MDHQPVLAQLPVPRKEIVDRRLPHFGRDLERIVGAGGLDRVEIVDDRGIDAGLPHRRHLIGLGEEALRPGAGLFVHVPVERRGQHQPLGGFEAERVDVGNQHEQARHLLAGLENAELAAELDGIDVVGRAAGDADDLRLRGLGLENEGRQVGRGERMRHRAEHLAAVLRDHLPRRRVPAHVRTRNRRSGRTRYRRRVW